MRQFAKFIPIVLIATLIARPVAGQSLGAFTDYDKHFIIFDDGNFRDVEFQEVRSFAMGSGCVAYVDNWGSLKAYANHISYDVSPSVTSYTITDNLFTFQVGSQLYVFEKGDKRLLSAYTGRFMVGDSIVAFIDTNSVHRVDAASAAVGEVAITRAVRIAGIERGRPKEALGTCIVEAGIVAVARSGKENVRVGGD